MAIDGITIRAITNELKNSLIGGHIQKIYQINNHVIILNIYNKTNYKLLISSNPQNARIHLTKGEYENPTTPPQFAMILRKYIQNSRVKDIKQIGMDRSVEIILETKDELGITVNRRLMVDIMGKYSNIVLTDENYKVIEAIKRISHEMSSVRAVYPGTIFSKLEDDKFDISKDFKNLSELDIPDNYKINKIFYMNFTGFGPAIGNEIAYRTNIDLSKTYGNLSELEKEKLNDSFKSICKLILENDFTPYLYEEGEKYLDFYPINLTHKYLDYSIKNTMSEALDFYFLNNVNDNSLNQTKENLKNQIINRIKKDNSKLINLNNDFNESKDFNIYRIEGDLLSTQAQKIYKGMDSIEVFNFYDNENQIINLDPKKTAWENIELKYKKSKKLYKANKLLAVKIPELNDEINYLNFIIKQINDTQTHEELEEIRDELISQNYIKNKNKKGKKTNNKNKSNYLKFITENGNYIYVGKNNKQNEDLTLRLANPNDYFFHIRNLPGSHVILRNDKEILDYEIEIAAFLAAKYSKNSNDRYIDIDYTQKKNVYKAKGSKPGMVYYTNFKTIRVDLEDEIGRYTQV